MACFCVNVRRRYFRNKIGVKISPNSALQSFIRIVTQPENRVTPIHLRDNALRILVIITNFKILAKNIYLRRTFPQEMSCLLKLT